ncbi:MAG: integrase arm-type DNA-binding domain-containing protein [Nitrospirae bacterium]|jgi:integrase|nr:integrase arm-type DNA-binding domain-containing protein [Nitrospirota bacterium]
MLTEVKIKTLKPKEKPYKLFDEKGLYLFVTPNGSKYWRYDYRYNGKRKTASFGVYPEVSLKQARQKRDEARASIRQGVDISQKKKKTEEAIYFKTIAMEWLQVRQVEIKPGHLKTIKCRLNKYILPNIGDKPLREITKSDISHIIDTLRKIGQIETARRVKQIISQVFRFAMFRDLTDKDPTIIYKLPPCTNKKHMPAILDPDKVGELLRKIESYRSYIVKNALLLLSLTFVRPFELRTAQWKEININEAVWDIPEEKTKTKVPHRVFLSRQAQEILKGLKNLTGTSPERYVFEGLRNKPISESTLNKALRSLGYNTKTEITSHGFRAMARTLIHEKLGYPPEVIEHQLAHKVPDRLGEAYNRTKFYMERKEMLQAWADYLWSLKGSSKRSSKNIK